MNHLITGIIAFVTGGAAWEGLKFFSPEVKRFLDARRLASKSFYQNLDPILKSASELYGKLESLAKEDFSTFINPSTSIALDTEQNKKYICYLFAQFWANVEHFRLESQYTDLSRIKKGEQLLRFVETFESRRFRILDRSMQRVIGECLIEQKDQKYRVLTLNEFIVQYDDRTSNLHNRLMNLHEFLMSVRDKEKRQRVLTFGVVVAALIDHFDPDYKTVRRRGIYLNKLSPKSIRTIQAQLLEHYIPFLSHKERYYKKKSPPASLPKKN